MATIGPSAGVCFVKVDGQQYQLRGSLTIDPTTLEATEIANLDGSITYTEKPVAPFMEMEISDRGGLSVVQMQAIRNATVTGELANGKTYVLGGAFTSGRLSLDASNGTIKWKLSGVSVNEIGVSS